MIASADYPVSPVSRSETARKDLPWITVRRWSGKSRRSLRILRVTACALCPVVSRSCGLQFGTMINAP